MADTIEDVRGRLYACVDQMIRPSDESKLAAQGMENLELIEKLPGEGYVHLQIKRYSGKDAAKVCFSTHDVHNTKYGPILVIAAILLPFYLMYRFKRWT
jgi:hypothetical protein